MVHSLLAQILDGLAYMHGKDIIHRDIKCANVMVDKAGIVHIGDFGLAKVLVSGAGSIDCSDEGSADKPGSASAVGTPHWSTSCKN